MDFLHAKTLKIEFASPSTATAVITDNTGPVPHSIQVDIQKMYPAVRTQHSGIWKNVASGINMYVQEYATGSTVIVYTYDAEHFRAFLTDMVGPSFQCDGMGGAGEFMSCDFTGTATAQVSVGPAGAAGIRASASSFSGQVVKLFYPESLDIDFEAEPTSGNAPLNVQFTDLSTAGRTAWLWDFGDDSMSTDRHPSHTFSAPGSYTILQLCSDGFAETTTVKSHYILVTGSDNILISGYVTTGGAPLDLVLVTFAGLGSVTTDAAGYFAMLAPSGWSGTAVPAKAGYTFMPASHSFSNVESTLTGRDFAASPVAVTSPAISGAVTAGGVPLSGVLLTLTGLGGVTTNASGAYTMFVPSGWSGTVTPSLAGYTFTPPSRSYAAVTSDQPNQDYAAASTLPASVTISGRVTGLGVGVEGVTLTFSGGGETAVTDAQGYYSHTIGMGWSGTATPSLPNQAPHIEFVPLNRTYSNVTTDQTNQDYSFTILQVTISGRVTGLGAGVEGVTLTFSGGGETAVTDAQGYYSRKVNRGWSGTATPSLPNQAPHIEFVPLNRTYSNVTTDQTNQDYSFTILYVTISGYVTWMGSGLVGVTLTFSSGGGTPVTVTTGAQGYYSRQVYRGWSGTVTPSNPGDVFNPPNREYSNVITNQTNQDYAAW